MTQIVCTLCGGTGLVIPTEPVENLTDKPKTPRLLEAYNLEVTPEEEEAWVCVTAHKPIA